MKFLNWSLVIGLLVIAPMLIGAGCGQQVAPAFKPTINLTITSTNPYTKVADIGSLAYPSTLELIAVIATVEISTDGTNWTSLLSSTEISVNLLSGTATGSGYVVSTSEVPTSVYKYAHLGLKELYFKLGSATSPILTPALQEQYFSFDGYRPNTATAEMADYQTPFEITTFSTTINLNYYIPRHQISGNSISTYALTEAPTTSFISGAVPIRVGGTVTGIISGEAPDNILPTHEVIVGVYSSGFGPGYNPFFTKVATNNGNGTASYQIPGLTGTLYIMAVSGKFGTNGPRVGSKIYRNADPVTFETGLTKSHNLTYLRTVTLEGVY